MSFVRGGRIGVAAALVTFGLGSALAQSPRPRPSTPTPTSTSTSTATATATPTSNPTGRVGTLGAIAQEIAKGLGPRDGRRLVVASAVTADLEPQKDRIEQLSTRVARLVAAAIGARAHDRPQTLALARAQARTDRELIYVQVEVQRGALLVNVDAYPVVRNGWERLKATPPPTAHAFARAPIDAEVRSFFTPLPLEKLTVRKAKHEETDVVALGCGDPDGGGTNLFIVSRDRIARGSIVGGKFIVSSSERLRTLAKRSPAPLREPLAGIVIAPRSHPNEIWVRESSRDGVRLDGSLHLLGSLNGLPVPFADDAACANVATESATLEPRLERCASSQTERTPIDMTNLGAAPAKSDAFLAWSGTAADGTPLALTLLARETTGTLRITVAGASQNVDNVGAEIAVGDLNLDGEPEVAYSADRGEDSIRLATVTSRGLLERGKWPAAEGVRAIAFCPAEQAGAPALAAIVGKEVWLVR